MGFTERLRMAYSAEIVSEGTPNGTDCTLGVPSVARTDTALNYPTSTNCTLVNPTYRQDPLLPGQSLAQVALATTTTFQLEVCSLPAGTSASTVTPYLLIQKNAVSPWMDPLTGQTLIVTPNGPGVAALPGTWSTATPLPTVFESSLFTSPLLAAPPSPVPAATYNLPAGPRHHYYFAQWVFICGQQVAWPTSFPSGQYFASEPFRVAVSNTH